MGEGPGRYCWGREGVEGEDAAGGGAEMAGCSAAEVTEGWRAGRRAREGCERDAGHETETDQDKDTKREKRRWSLSSEMELLINSPIFLIFFIYIKKYYIQMRHKYQRI